jgi:DNA-directed RNA polymerase subunit M/transcription elongation factor TFIIS
MPDLKLTCDNCGSMFTLNYEEEEVSYNPTHCPFCGDFYDNENEELDFNDNEESDFYNEESDLVDDEDDDYRRH